MIHAHAEAGKNTKNVAVARVPFRIPGFRVATAASGMRYSGRSDLALIWCDDPAAAAGVFTRNRFCAAPVQICREHLDRSRAAMRAVLVNAGIANACTGEEGLHNGRLTAAHLARELDIDPTQVLIASTGVIGPQLKLQPLFQTLPELIGGLAEDHWDAVARAIMTTDTVPKWATTRVELCGRPVTIGGVAKGAGMIAPDMATLIALVCTDAAVSAPVLNHWLHRAADASFNAITIDGDTSTNDTLLALAGGRAGHPPLATPDGPDSERFGAALQVVLEDLARQIVLDGEGATKLMEICVSGARSEADARRIAFTIAQSPLVKTAFFGEDANWGRVVAAAGRAGIELDPAKVSLRFGDVTVFQDGMPLLTPEVERAASRVLKQREIPVHLALGEGTARFTVRTCDFSYDYVKINADYRS